jgi:hypothetical protein
MRLRGVGEAGNILLQAGGAAAPGFRSVGGTGDTPGVAHLFHSYAGEIYQQHRADKKRRGEQQGKQKGVDHGRLLLAAKVVVAHVFRLHAQVVQQFPYR